MSFLKISKNFIDLLSISKVSAGGRNIRHFASSAINSRLINIANMYSISSIIKMVSDSKSYSRPTCSY